MPRQKHADCEKSLIAYMPNYGTYAPPVNGGIGPFGSPVAQGGSYLTAIYIVGGSYYVPEAVAAEEARWQRILADFAAKRDAYYEKRREQARTECLVSPVCSLLGRRRPYKEGFTSWPKDPSGLTTLLGDKSQFTANKYSGLLHEGVTGSGTMDYRSFNGEFGSGSLQVDVGTLGVDFDVDRFNPDQGIVSGLEHFFLEVTPHWFRGY